MKRRALIVGSALASVGAVLGVKKASEGVSHPVSAPIAPDPSEKFKLVQPAIDVFDAAQIEEMQLDAIRRTDWYQDLLRYKVMNNLGMSGYQMQQFLNPSWYREFPKDEAITSKYTAPGFEGAGYAIQMWDPNVDPGG